MGNEARSSSHARGYTWRWRQAAKQFLRDHPLCVKCRRLARVTQATTVDHKIPHKGDQKLFWDRANWQGLCDTCHSSVKQAEEHGGREIGCDAEGMPLDAQHRWNRGAG